MAKPQARRRPTRAERTAAIIRNAPRGLSTADVAAMVDRFMSDLHSLYLIGDEEKRLAATRQLIEYLNAMIETP